LDKTFAFWSARAGFWKVRWQRERWRNLATFKPSSTSSTTQHTCFYISLLYAV
jgi:hypothetical protein